MKGLLQSFMKDRRSEKDAESQKAAGSSAAAQKLMYINYRTDNGKRQSNRDRESDAAQTIFPMMVEVRNGRLTVPQPQLRTHGFELLRFGNDGSDAFGCGLQLREDYLDDVMVKQILYPWCEAVVRHVTGAATVRCFHHLVRGGGKASAHRYASLAHSDYTTSTAYKLFETMPSSSEGGFKNFKGRYAVLNVWKNINPAVPIANHHLAMCDATTVVAPDDFIEFEKYESPSDTSPTRSFHMSPNNHRRHRWYYFPDMTINEAIVFMQYDSDSCSRCRYTFHTSVTDPCGPTAFNRESIELRLAAWFPDPANNTVPDFSVAPQMRVPGAVLALRDAVQHLKLWDAKGSAWLHGCIASGDFAGIIRGICTHSRSEGNKGAYKDLTDSDIQQVVGILMADSAFADSLVQATGVLPMAQSSPPQKIDEACQAVLEAVKYVSYWDQNGKAWVASAVNQGNFEGIARGLCTHMRSDAKKPQFASLTDGDINAVASRLMRQFQFESVVRTACKSLAK
jgi:hypothetical protein